MYQFNVNYPWMDDRKDVKQMSLYELAEYNIKEMTKIKDEYPFHSYRNTLSEYSPLYDEVDGDYGSEVTDIFRYIYSTIDNQLYKVLIPMCASTRLHDEQICKFLRLSSSNDCPQDDLQLPIGISLYLGDSYYENTDDEDYIQNRSLELPMELLLYGIENNLVFSHSEKILQRNESIMKKYQLEPNTPLVLLGSSFREFCDVVENKLPIYEMKKHLQNIEANPCSIISFSVFIVIENLICDILPVLKLNEKTRRKFKMTVDKLLNCISTVNSYETTKLKYYISYNTKRFDNGDYSNCLTLDPNEYKDMKRKFRDVYHELCYIANEITRSVKVDSWPKKPLFNEQEVFEDFEKLSPPFKRYRPEYKAALSALPFSQQLIKLDDYRDWNYNGDFKRSTDKIFSIHDNFKLFDAARRFIIPDKTPLNMFTYQIELKSLRNWSYEYSSLLQLFATSKEEWSDMTDSVSNGWENRLGYLSKEIDFINKLGLLLMSDSCHYILDIESFQRMNPCVYCQNPRTGAIDIAGGETRETIFFREKILIYINIIHMLSNSTLKCLGEYSCNSFGLSNETADRLYEGLSQVIALVNKSKRKFDFKTYTVEDHLEVIRRKVESRMKSKNVKMHEVDITELFGKGVSRKVDKYEKQTIYVKERELEWTYYLLLEAVLKLLIGYKCYLICYLEDMVLLHFLPEAPIANALYTTIKANIKKTYKTDFIKFEKFKGKFAYDMNSEDSDDEDGEIIFVFERELYYHFQDSFTHLINSHDSSK